jgi:hypothetical protein
LAYVLILTFEIEDSMEMGGKKHEKNEPRTCEKKHHKGSIKTSKKGFVF